jgi:seryl-tRNA synthetase
MPVTEQAAGQMMQGQHDTSVLEAMIAHVNAHYNAAIAQGTKKELLAQVKSLLDQAGEALAKLKQLDAQAEQLAAQHQDFQAGAVPAQPAQPIPQQ